MTDDKDRRLLVSLLSIFYSRELIEQEGYHVCEGDMYYIPPHGPYQVLLSPPSYLYPFIRWRTVISIVDAIFMLLPLRFRYLLSS